MKKKCSLLPLATVSGLLIALPVCADVIAEYDFTGDPIANPTSVDLNADASSMTVSGTAAGFSGNLDNIYFQPLRTEDTEAASLNGTSYFTFSVTADIGYQLDLSSLTFDFGGTNNQGVDVEYSYSMQTSVDGIGSGNPITGNGTVTVGQVGNTIFYGPNQSISLSGTEYQGLSTITIRVNPWTATDSTDTIRVTNVVLNGTVSAIPEPSTFAIALAGIIGVLVVYRRFRTR